MYIPHAITRSGEPTMRATICKWGNSLGLRIPRGLAEDAGLTVVMNRCPKIEYSRLYGELSWGGFNSGVISSKRRKA